MLIDCDSCVVRDLACSECVVNVMFGSPPTGIELDDEELRALSVLADAGLVPRLRLVTPAQTGTDQAARGVTGRASMGSIGGLAGGAVGHSAAGAVGGVVAAPVRAARRRPVSRRIA
jgi:hypothetical protein